jgi:hypothetical protein
MRRGGKLAVLLLVAAVAVTVAALAAPRVLASIRYLPVDRALAQYYTTNEIPTNRLNVLIRFAGEAIGHHDHFRYRDGLSQLHYLRGLDMHTPASERRGAYRSAETEAATSLERGPAQSAVWLRLATIRWILHDEPETIVEPWKMSVFTGRTHSALYTHRVELGLAHHAHLNREGRAMLLDQLRLAWRARPGTLIRVLARRDPGLDVTRYLLGDSDPDTLAEMEAWLERLR